MARIKEKICNQWEASLRVPENVKGLRSRSSAEWERGGPLTRSTSSPSVTLSLRSTSQRCWRARPLVFTIHDVHLFQMRPYFSVWIARAQLPGGGHDGGLRARDRSSQALRRGAARSGTSSAQACCRRCSHSVRRVPTARHRARPEAPLDSSSTSARPPPKNLQRMIERTRWRGVRSARSRPWRSSRHTDARPVEASAPAIRPRGSVVLRVMSPKWNWRRPTPARSARLPVAGEGFACRSLSDGAQCARSSPAMFRCADLAGDARRRSTPSIVGEIAAAMVRLFRHSELRADLVRKGHQRASEFTGSAPPRRRST